MLFAWARIDHNRQDSRAQHLRPAGQETYPHNGAPVVLDSADTHTVPVCALAPTTGDAYVFCLDEHYDPQQLKSYVPGSRAWPLYRMPKGPSKGSYSSDPPTRPVPGRFWQFRSGDTFVRVAVPFSGAHGRWVLIELGWGNEFGLFPGFPCV